MLTRLLNKKMIEYGDYTAWRLEIESSGTVFVMVPTETGRIVWQTWRYWDTYDLFLDWLCGDE